MNLFYFILFFLFFINIILGFKPLICFYFVVLDFIKRDRKIFRGYGFLVFVGLGGSGKTLSMVNYLREQKKKYPKVKIFTNFDCIYSDGKIDSWVDIIDAENFETIEIDKKEYDRLVLNNDISNIYSVGSDGADGEPVLYYKKVHYGVIFGFDEIHLTFNSTKWQDCPENFLEYISQQRKLHKQIISTSQVFNRIDKKLREQTNYVIDCKCIASRWVFNRYFRTCDYLVNSELGDNGIKKRRRSKRNNFISYNSLYYSYDTNQVLCELRKGKSEESQFVDKFKNLF